ncbi:unnamed protein product [Cuscuta europaea]|uniref:Uncharacterized protein n=1 Tax=Cuscuta europaea TaxID=41803 RepID=A0A9P1A0Q2_CUSEU|nr:unnamed protein product [Cuscuta europaea]
MLRQGRRCPQDDGPANCPRLEMGSSPRRPRAGSQDDRPEIMAEVTKSPNSGSGNGSRWKPTKSLARVINRRREPPEITDVINEVRTGRRTSDPFGRSLKEGHSLKRGTKKKGKRKGKRKNKRGKLRTARTRRPRATKNEIPTTILSTYQANTTHYGRSKTIHADLTSAQRRPSSETSAQRRPSSQTSAQRRPSFQTSAQRRPSSQTSAQRRPSFQTSAQRRPSSQTSAQRRPSSQTSAQRRPSS